MITDNADSGAAMFDQGLLDYLDALRWDDCFRVDERLKMSPTEETQRVYFVGANGAEQGPYIRKYIDRDAGLGDVYRVLCAARRSGRRFRYLPAVYSCCEQGDRLVVLMEHASGCTLRELVERTDPADRVDLVSLVVPALCDAVAELHEGLDTPVVHRDLTPSNVLCPPDAPASLTLIDLGISRRYKPGEAADTAYFGTRCYAAPEQYGFAQTDPRTDVYALGLTLFFCLTGCDPEPADRARGFADPAVPDPLRAVIARAASLDARDRYGSACELKAALARALGEVGEAYEKTVCPVAPVHAARPPLWVGKVWNAAVVISCALIVYACVSLTIDPGSHTAIEPLALRVYGYLVFMDVNALVVAYLLLDRRSMAWRRRVLGPHPVRREMLWGLAVLTVNWAAFGVAVLAMGASA